MQQDLGAGEGGCELVNTPQKPEMRRGLVRVKVPTLLAIMMLSAFGASASGSEVDASAVQGAIESVSVCPNDDGLIALGTRHQGQNRLWVGHATQNRWEEVKAAGQSTSLFSASRELNGSFVWRPIMDGRGRHWFAFVGQPSGEGRVLYVGWYGGESVIPVASGLSGIGWPRWSPDGMSIAFHAADSEGGRGGRIYLLTDLGDLLGKVDPMGTRVRSAEQLPLDNDALYPDWSPDGRSLAFSVLCSGGAGAATGVVGWNIGAIDLKRKKDLAVLTPSLESTSEWQPTWSPNGDYVAFWVAEPDEAGPDGQPDLSNTVINLKVSRARDENCKLAGGQVPEGTFPFLARDLVVDPDRGPMWGAPGTYEILAVARNENVRGNELVRPILRCSVLPWSAGEGRETYLRVMDEAPTSISRFALTKSGERMFALEVVGLSAALHGLDVPVGTIVEEGSEYAELVDRLSVGKCKGCWSPWNPCFDVAASLIAGGTGWFFWCVVLGQCDPPPEDLLGEPPLPTGLSR